ncbi:UBA/UAS domain-containing protein Ucp10 [Schizosaccharomyces cryophilus OY26]|uniref:UBA/UAS domain-containing protein Ucp10 n=1 Tax=Schizosaccharomyces cryophilus (strain OY26 / ATCC MYA-4695 / CBS 11777 / NBRC 106824 / NRRL Y48691) TaxID=653667 RepID=S9X2Q4_SCHCR|nr:UBA/UAS domain-containing protein Ucp10 [Schizosaccharomyces cryophilus OY26]EPY51362.1 UBA/UAS domain-containing protein Ucp10 [Schizosaccharomyces cryophilus OY26]
MSRSGEQEAIQALQSSLDVPVDTAQSVLESFNWNVQEAVEFLTGESSQESRKKKPLPGFGFFHSIFSFIFSGFYKFWMFLSRVPLLPTFLPILGARKRYLSPADAANKLLQNLEEQYGTNHIDFFTEGGYMEALARTKRSFGVALLFFTSTKSDDMEDFSKKVLMDEEVKGFLSRRNILCWVGDVCEDEAFQGSRQFNCTKFPSAVLIMYSPQLSELVVAAHLHGPMDSTLLQNTLTNALARHLPSLERFRTERESRESTRELRRQQDDAYQASLARDRERQKQAKEERERKQKEQEEKERMLKLSLQYRSWLAVSIPSEPQPNTQAARLSIRLPDGTRVIRRFEKDCLVKSIYEFVDSLLFAKEEPEVYEQAMSSSAVLAPPENYQHKFHFSLYSSLPREILEMESTICDLPSVFPSGTVVVELED